MESAPRFRAVVFHRGPSDDHGATHPRPADHERDDAARDAQRVARGDGAGGRGTITYTLRKARGDRRMSYRIVLLPTTLEGEGFADLTLPTIVTTEQLEAFIADLWGHG